MEGKYMRLEVGCEYSVTANDIVKVESGCPQQGKVRGKDGKATIAKTGKYTFAGRVIKPAKGREAVKGLHWSNDGKPILGTKAEYTIRKKV